MGHCWCASVSSTCQNGDKNSADCLVCDAVMSTKSMARKLSRLYIPVSSTLCLGLLCPSIAQEYRTAQEKIRRLDESAPGLADTFMKNPKETRAFCEGVVSGTPIPVVEDNVIMLNSLQVMYSSRFVYCEYEKFSLVKRMLENNERYREGLRPTLS